MAAVILIGHFKTALVKLGFLHQKPAAATTVVPGFDGAELVKMMADFQSSLAQVKVLVQSTSDRMDKHESGCVADRAEAKLARREMHEKMDTLKRDMQTLSNHVSKLEGKLER